MPGNSMSYALEAVINSSIAFARTRLGDFETDNISFRILSYMTVNLGAAIACVNLELLP